MTQCAVFSFGFSGAPELKRDLYAFRAVGSSATVLYEFKVSVVFLATADVLALVFSLLEPVGFALTLDVADILELPVLPLLVEPLDGVPLGSLDVAAVGGSFCFFSAGGLSFSEPDELVDAPLDSSGDVSALRFL